MNKRIQVKDHRTGKVIFGGDFPTLRECVEQAVVDRVVLNGANLSEANLINASLDDAQMQNACFRNANLMGANLSEASLDNADFTNANLQSACLCFSSLKNCRFEGTAFGATDIAGCDISGSIFSTLSTLSTISTLSTLSAFSLNFIDAISLSGCRYLHEGTACGFSCPPVVISGLPFAISMMDEHILTGSRLWLRKEIRALANDNRPAARPGGDGGLYAFIRSHKGLFRELPGTPG